jgi:FkbM family methyltransferase
MNLSTVEVGGMKFAVRPDSSDLKAIREVIERKSYRRKTFELNDAAWLDFGANIGAFTVLVGRLGSRVVAFEPDPESFYILKRNVELNGLVGRVELVQAAVTHDVAVKSLTLHQNSKNRNFWRNSVIHKWRGGTSVEVPAVYWKNAVRDGWSCKMDIEGSEMGVIEQMSERKFNKLVFEWSFDIDGSIPRFVSAVGGLRGVYSNVVYAKFDESKPVWDKSWFPPCRTVWCW